jgi:hypothetical protein
MRKEEMTELAEIPATERANPLPPTQKFTTSANMALFLSQDRFSR